MEDFNVVNDTQETVVESQETEATTSEVTETVETVETVEPPAKVQSAEDNARFAAARREAEQQTRALQAQNDRLMAALSQYGYQGTPEEIADALMAQTQGITVEQARAEREAAEAENAKYTQLQTEAETYKSYAREYFKAQDLATLKSTYPDDAKVQAMKSIDEMGDDFFALMGALKDPVLAYDAIQAKAARETKPIPKDIGAINSSSSKEKDFYTPAEVDKLTDKDYDNPRIMDAVRKSMLKWSR